MKRNKSTLIQLNWSQAKELRKELYKKQKGICPILKKKIDFDDSVLDHKHKRKDETAGPFGRGLIRGVIHNQVNSLEGIIVKKYIRQGVHNLIPLPDFLRNLADYLENPPCPQKYIHPDERPKPKKLSKREYNKIKKHFKKLHPRAKMPKYPHKGKLTKIFEELLKKIKDL